MPRRTDSRSRMIHAAAELFRQRGYHATTVSDVVRESGAPRGSTYFHFPGGKAELAREAIARAGDEVEEMVDQAARHAGDPASLIRAMAHILTSRLERSGYHSGCAIATMVLELAPRDEAFTAGFDNVFARWRAALITRLEPWGLPPARGEEHGGGEGQGQHGDNGKARQVGHWVRSVGSSRRTGSTISK